MMLIGSFRRITRENRPRLVDACLDAENYARMETEEGRSDEAKGQEQESLPGQWNPLFPVGEISNCLVNRHFALLRRRSKVSIALLSCAQQPIHRPSRASHLKQKGLRRILLTTGYPIIVGPLP